MARVTIADVAREAGVSTMTVSRVINAKGEISEATRQRVQRAIDRLGYRPSAVARSLTTNRSRTLGLVIPDITNPFFPEIVRGAEDAAWREGYAVMLCNTVEDEAREAQTLERLEDNRVAGVILCSARLPDLALRRLIRRHPAVVTVNRIVPGVSASTVEVDDAYGAMRAVHHLLSRGREVIGLLAGPAASVSGHKRLAGYSAALETSGRQVDADLIVRCAPDEAGGYGAARALLERRPAVGALVGYNDLVAIGALRACAELGLEVPGEVAVIGCDDIRMASLVTPALTTLRVSQRDIGERAVALLLEQLQSQAAPRVVTLKPELVVRDSAP